ncbi:MAG: Fic family protein [Lentisphaeraceae bacterium]|nr:Fic family protein [Lentisphaeraceae bacterium]
MKRYSLKVSSELHGQIRALGSQQKVILSSIDKFFELNLNSTDLPEWRNEKRMDKQLSYAMPDELFQKLADKTAAPTSREVLKLIRRILHWYVEGELSTTQKRLYFDGLDEDLALILKNRMCDEWTHYSTAIEGNTLTLGETSFVLNEGLTISGKSLREHDEISGHARAIDIIYQMLTLDTLREEDLFELHKAVIINAPYDSDKPAGVWKRVENGAYWGREYILFPSPRNTPQLMNNWLKMYNSSSLPESITEAVHLYSELHRAFASIHPFFDGNGRLARLIANLPLLKAGFPPISIDKSQRFDYLELMRNYKIVDEDKASLELSHDHEEFSDFAYLQWKKTLKIVDEVRAIQRERA